MRVKTREAQFAISPPPPNFSPPNLRKINLGARTKMKLVSSRGRTIDCFLSIVTVLGGRWRGASNDVKTPLLADGLTSDLLLALK